MCSLFSIGPTPKNGKKQWERDVTDMLHELGRDYVSPGLPGVVVLNLSGRYEPRNMRWGFQRSWSKRPIHNARDDKLSGKTWAEPFQNHRCIVPMTAFYEWSGQKGKKTKHTINTGSEGIFYVAGIWEEEKENSYFSIITTTPTKQMADIHDRMPVILQLHELDQFLSSEEPPTHLIRPYPKDLRISPPPELTLGL